jgi:protein-S-isoprenylcysteine O-methyltransferase Ste14
MRVAHALVACLWVAFVLCWLNLARFNKKASRRSPWRGMWGLRVAILVVVLAAVLLRRHGIAGRLAAFSHSLPAHPGIPEQWAGVGLCLAGFGFAVWARVHLGRNWGMPMSLREGHELVTSGPYVFVRHPIYTGLMLAVIGTALTESLTWLFVFPLYFAYFLVSARTEEKMMLAQFPDTYPAYRRRTKMLIPFVF